MTTISKFVIEARLDPTGVRAGAAQILSTLKAFKKGSIAKLDFDVPSAARDLKQIQGILATAQRDFQNRMAMSREELFRGDINQKQFALAGKNAAETFNKSILGGISRLEAKGLLPDHIRAALVSQLKNAGLAAGTAFSKNVRSATAAHPLLGNLTTTGQRAANTLLNGLNSQYKSRVQQIRESFASGLLTVTGFRKAGQKAAEAYDHGLLAGIRSLRGRGLATADITEALNSQFKLAGTKAANAFLLSARRQLGTNIRQIGTSMTLGMTVPLVAAGTAATKLAANFDTSMRRVRVILKPTGDQMERLTKQARQLGAQTQFSATDAAQAQAKLAQQGLNVQQVLAAMPTIVNVAAASLTTLTEAADAATTILFGFGIPIKDLELAMDQIVLLSLRSKTNLGELQAAFRTVGPVARQAGQDFVTIASAIGGLSKAGLTGTLGGTALRNILTRLTNATPEARRALEELGISAFNADHKMRDLVDIVKQFEVAQARSANQEQFLKRLDTIFETRGGVGFSTLLLATSAGLQKLQAEIKAAGGTAADVGKVQMEGLIGAFRELINTTQEFALSIFTSGLGDALKKVVLGLAEVFRWLSKLSPGMLKFIGVIGILAATLGPVIALFGTMVTTIIILNSILLQLGGPAILGALIVKFGLWGVAIAAVVTALGYLMQGAIAAQMRMQEFTMSLTKMDKASLQGMHDALVLMIQVNEMALAMEKRKQVHIPGVPDLPTKRFKELTEETRLLREQLTAVTQAMKDMQDRAALLENVGIDTSKLLADLERMAEALGDLNLGGVGGGKDPFEEFVDSVERSLGLLEAVDFRMARMPGLAEELAKQYAGINRLIAAEGDKLTDTKRILIELRRKAEEAFAKIDWSRTFSLAEAQAALDKIPPVALRVRPIIDRVERIQKVDFLKDFREAANQAISAKIDLDFAKRLGNQAVIAQATKNYVSALSKAEGAELRVRVAIQQSNLPLAEKEQLLETITTLLGKYTDEEISAAKAGRTVAQRLEALATGVRGILQLAEAFGEVDENIRRAIESIALLADSVAQLKQAQVAKDLVGQVASVVGIIGGVFGLLQGLSGMLGESETEKQRNQLMRENNKELARLRLELAGFTGSASQRFTLSRQLLAITSGPHSRFKEQVEALGFTMEELGALAEDAGVQIFDSAGNIIPAALKVWGEKLALTVEQLTRFGKSLDAQQERLDIRRNVFNLPDNPQAILQEQLDILKSFAPALYEMFFQGLDASTAAGRAELEKRLQALFEFIDANRLTLDPTLLGLLEGFPELLDIIVRMADAFDGTREAADALAASLLHVPSGYKLELARFNATMAEINRNLIASPPTPIPIPAGPALPPGVVATGGPVQTMVFHEGSIVIQGADKPAAQLFEEIRKEAKRRARGIGALATTSDTLDLG